MKKLILYLILTINLIAFIYPVYYWTTILFVNLKEEK